MWYSLETAPELGNRFRLRLRCVRACVRAKLRVRDDSAVARVGQINFSVVRPSVRPARVGPETLSLLLAWVFVRMFN